MSGIYNIMAHPCTRVNFMWCERMLQKKKNHWAVGGMQILCDSESHLVF